MTGEFFCALSYHVCSLAKFVNNPSRQGKKMSAPVIQVSSLSRRFGDKNAICDLTLDVQAGEIFGFLGHNGAGKTTTVRLLNGVLEPTAGNARVLGLDPQTEGPALRAQTGVLTETPSLDERLTARENLSFYAEVYNLPPAAAAVRVHSLLAEFELAERADEKVSGYSKGMKQRLALARALLHKPKVLFLDEPTAALDPIAARHVHQLVETLARREGRTVFLCTHNLVEAQKLCDRVAVMEHGRLVALGTPSDLTRQYVRRLDVELEVDPVQTDVALQIIQQYPQLLIDPPKQEKDVVILRLSGREYIPELLSVLVRNGLRVYRLAPQEANLEEVYFTLNGGRS
jgi:ABC-2 type transport system ATP-binding protein